MRHKVWVVGLSVLLLSQVVYAELPQDIKDELSKVNAPKAKPKSHTNAVKKHYRAKKEQSVDVEQIQPAQVNNIVIGENYEGGIVFYVDSGGSHGLIAASTDQGKYIEWYFGSDSTIGASNTAIGTGKLNTESIINKYGKGSYAAKLCDDLVIGQYTDWYLPSKDELNLMYENIGNGASGVLKNRGRFASFHYWSSSEYDNGFAWSQGMGKGNQSKSSKYAGQYVRAIRNF